MIAEAGERKPEGEKIPAITRIRITVGDHVQDHLTQEKARDVLAGCRRTGVKPHIEVWFNGTAFAPVHAWLDATLPQGHGKTVRHYAPDL